MRIEHVAKTFSFLRALFRRLRRRNNFRAIEFGAAIVAVNSFRFVFTPAFRTDQLGHAAVSFFGLVSDVDVDPAGAGVIFSFTPEDLSGVTGVSFLAASL